MSLVSCPKDHVCCNQLKQHPEGYISGDLFFQWQVWQEDLGAARQEVTQTEIGASALP